MKPGEVPDVYDFISRRAVALRVDRHEHRPGPSPTAASAARDHAHGRGADIGQG